MAQIPDFTALGGRPTPTPSSRRPLDDQSGQIIARAGEGLGQSLEQVGNDQYVRNTNMARAQASNAALDHEIAVKTQAEQIQQQVVTGQLPYDQARQTYDDAVSKIPAPQIPNLDPVGAENFQKALKRTAFTGGLAIDQTVKVARQNDFKDQFAANLDKLGKLAGMPDANIEDINSRAEAFRPLAREAGVPAPLVDRAIQDFKDRNWQNDATQRAMESKDSMDDLKQLEHDLTAKDGFYAGKLDTDKRNAVLRTVVNDRLILENRAEHLADKREAIAQRALYQIDQQVSSGVPATPQMWADWEAKVKGTSAEGEFKQHMDDEGTVQSVLRKPIPEQLKFVQDQQAALDSQGGSLRERANLARLTNAVQSNVKQLQTTPLLFNANRTGQSLEPLDLSTLGNPAKAGALEQGMQDRMETLAAMRKQYGDVVPLRPLLPQEAQAISGALDSSTPQQQSQIFASLHKAIGDEQAYKATMQQIAPDSPVRALAGMIAGKQATVTLNNHWFRGDDVAQSADVAATMLQGEQMLNATKADKASDGKPKVGLYLPEDTTLQSNFQNRVGSVFAGRPGAAEVAYQAVKSYYVGRAAQTGRLAATKEDVDDKLIKEAINATLGSVVDYRGNGEVLAPWGMDADTFRDRAHAALPTPLRDADVGLRNFGDGTYYVTQGRNFVHDAQGQPLTIDVNAPEGAKTNTSFTFGTPQGLSTPGNLDPWNRKVLHNSDGSVSTTSSMSIGTKDGEVLIPTVVDGKRLSKDEAITHFRKTGEHLGVFDTPEHADVYAEALHNEQARRMGLGQ